jgi:6-phosphogluconolactonase (cycloisomerase 2 family)
MYRHWLQWATMCKAIDMCSVEPDPVLASPATVAITRGATTGTDKVSSKRPGLVCALLCSLACGCGGGGGSGGNAGTPPTAVTTDTLLAVTNATAGSIDLFTIDAKTGVPTSVASSPVRDGPTPAGVAIDPLKRFIYVVSTMGDIRGYAIVASNLTLTAIAGSPFSVGSQSAAIAIDPDGQFVLTANAGANTVSVFSIGSNGSLTEVPGSPFAAGADPQAIVVTGRFVYAANAAGSSVSAYILDPTSGALRPVSGSPFATPGRPTGLVVDPTGTHLYVSESQPNEMSGFSIDGASGALSTIPSSPFAASFPIRSPVIDAAGKRLHLSNGTAVDCFEVDANTAALSEIGVSPTNGRSSIALSLDGPDNFLYVLDNVANQIEVFSIDTVSGALILIAGSPFALFAGAGQETLGPNAIALQH